MTRRDRLEVNFKIATEAILTNKIRSFLTALGIIFGVAAVISMLAIGNGARKEILEQIKLVGVNNIVITPLSEQSEGKAEEQEGDARMSKKKFSPGLSVHDMNSIREVLPGVERISPEIVIETSFVRNGLTRTGKLVGVEPSYFEITDFSLISGSMFNQKQLEYGEQVCIIGNGISSKFFSKEDPLGKYIKCGQNWLLVVGVLSDRAISKASMSNLGIRDVNMDIYTPLKTVLLRYKNRAMVSKGSLQQQNSNEEGNTEKQEQESYHQLDKLVVQVSNTELLTASSDAVSRLLLRKHMGVTDFEITVPELLLKQQQRTKDIFNIVLGAIAGISLLVGGIGIMNIMLASVLERIKEIGIRLSLGARKEDIVQQFLFESVLISLTGGIGGVILGVVLSVLVARIAEIETIISALSIFVSFGVSAMVGLIFGIAPARRAAEQDPIKSLRHE